MAFSYSIIAIHFNSIAMGVGNDDTSTV